MGASWTRWSPADARSVLAELEASGLSVAEFARRRGVHPERLRRWRARYRGEHRPVGPRLVELVAAAPRGALRVLCPSGHVVELVDVELGLGLRLVLDAAAERQA